LPKAELGGNDGDSKTIYPRVWQYPQPNEHTRYAGSLMLSVVELVHYLVFATQLAVAYAFYHFSDSYSGRCASLFLVMMAPVFQVLAGAIPVLMHEFDTLMEDTRSDSADREDLGFSSKLNPVVVELA
jgi:hypothetical protein